MSKNVGEIVHEWLEGNGYDGLYSLHDDECSCLASSLFPCDEDPFYCRAGYKVIPPKGANTKYSMYVCENRTGKPWEKK